MDHVPAPTCSRSSRFRREIWCQICSNNPQELLTKKGPYHCFHMSEQRTKALLEVEIVAFNIKTIADKAL